MEETRRIVSLGLEARSRANIKIRQPLGELRIKNYELSKEYSDLIRDEVNIKNIRTDGEIGSEVELDTNITPELEEEGKVREEIRHIQELRKEKGLNPNDKLEFVVPEEKKSFYLKHGKAISAATNTIVVNK